MSKYNICKKCSHGLNRKDCSDEDYEECIREYEEERELAKRVAERFLKPREE